MITGWIWSKAMVCWKYRRQAQDLVPGSDKQLKSLLATTAPAKGAAATQAARSVPKNDVEDFKVLGSVLVMLRTGF